VDRSEIARDNMKLHKMNCAQAVLAAFCEDLGWEIDDALRIAMGFGGGMGYTGGTCGAVTGAYMVIGLKIDFNVDQLQACKEKAYALVHEFDAKFKQLHGTVLCGELLGYDLRDPAQLEAARAEGVFPAKCPGFVSEAVKILEALKY
jgi:C_GCAxxG_C_C family probable redox protein